MPKQHRILLLAFPNGQLLDIAGPLQMFAGANDGLKRLFYRIEIAAPHVGMFATSSGVRLVADLAFRQITTRRLASVDTLLTVGGEPGVREQLADGTVTEIVARSLGRVPRIASICNGTFFLAAAGAALTTPERSSRGFLVGPTRKMLDVVKSASALSGSRAHPCR